MSDDYLARLTRVMDEAGITTYEVMRRRRHRAAVIRIGAKSRKVFFPASGSDHRGPRAFVKDLRRTIRELRS